MMVAGSSGKASFQWLTVPADYTITFCAG